MSLMDSLLQGLGHGISLSNVFNSRGNAYTIKLIDVGRQVE